MYDTPMADGTWANNPKFWKKVEEYEWDRVQRMRAEGHPLMMGGNCNEVPQNVKLTHGKGTVHKSRFYG